LFYIAIEGVDGAGTTTHSRLLQERLSQLGYCVHIIEEPSKGPVGAVIRHALSQGPFRQDLMTLLFAADRLYQWYNHVEKIEKDCVLVADRSFISSLVYQSLDLFPGSVDVDWIYTVNKHIPKPDLVIYLDVEPEVAFARLVKRGKLRDIPEELANLRALAARYRTVLKMLSGLTTIVLVKGSSNGIDRPLGLVAREVLLAVLASLRYRELARSTQRRVSSRSRDDGDKQWA
jgi:dTMP kinase